MVTIECSQPREFAKEDMVVDGLQHTMVLEEETRDVIINILNEAEEQARLVHGVGRIVPTVEVGGHYIYKSILVSQWNGSVFLGSKDRLG